MRAAVRLLMAMLMACLANACTHVDRPGDASRPHHRPGGFQNNYLDFEPRGLPDLLRWRWQAWRAGLPTAPEQPVPARVPELQFVQANGAAGAAMQPALTWIGHATALVQAGGLNVLTDPIFSDRASPLSFFGPKRAQPPGLSLLQLPHIDLVLVSHNHYDHLDAPSVMSLNQQVGGPPLFIVPLGLKAWLAERGITRAIELDWWQSHRLGDTEILLAPVQHWSGRGLHDRMHTLWGGFAVFSPDLHWYFSGDTGYSRDFADLRQRLRGRPGGGDIDLALIPIGAYAPRWFMAQQHVDPAESVQIHLDLGARQSMGLHWGTFELTDEALDQPPKDLARARTAAGLGDDAFFVQAVGQTRRLAPRALATGRP